MKNLHEKMKTAQHHVRTQHHSSYGVMVKLLAILMLACFCSVANSQSTSKTKSIVIPIDKESGTHDISVGSDKMFNFVLNPPVDTKCVEGDKKYSVTLTYAAVKSDNSPCDDKTLVIQWNDGGVKIGNDDRIGHDKKDVYVFTSLRNDSKIQSAAVPIGNPSASKILQYPCLPEIKSNGSYFTFTYTRDPDDGNNCATSIEIIGASKYIATTPIASTTSAATTPINGSPAITATTTSGTAPSGPCTTPEPCEKPYVSNPIFLVIVILSGALIVILIVTIIVLFVFYYRSKKSPKKTVKKDAEAGKKKDQKKDATKDQKKAPEKDKKKDSKEDKKKPETESEFAARIKKYSDSHGNYDAMADPANKSIFETTSETTSEDSTEESTGSK